MKTIDELLIQLRACEEARVWAQGKTFEEVYTTCHRGDWLCWLFAKTNPKDVQLITLVKGHQANTVRHLMKDERSLKAVDTAIAFGEGRATEEELSRAADAARPAAYAAWDTANAAWATARAAEGAVDAASYAAYTAASSAASYASDVADYSARAAVRSAEAAATVRAARTAACAVVAAAANQQLTADIFRKYISIEKFKI